MPEIIKSCFWDVNISKLDIEKNKLFIISRIFSFGNDEAFSWLLNTYEEEDIVNTAKNSRNFTLKSARFLKNIYNIQEEEMKFFVNAKSMGDFYFI